VSSVSACQLLAALETFRTELPLLSLGNCARRRFVHMEWSSGHSKFEQEAGQSGG
jgi:hypothetical protein